MQAQKPENEVRITVSDLLTIPQAANHLGVHFTTLYRWLKAGKFYVVRVGGREYVSISEVDRLKVEMEKKR